jgi:hypothetical protein
MAGVERTLLILVEVFHGIFDIKKGFMNVREFIWRRRSFSVIEA